ncbi:serine/threonine-protein kinase [Stigmatella aurantiaca]|uniref:Protein kinase n=1 Tax=Stigmatella aurantiaca (strain DW4/3-1) TaxID=378806 RepID=Q094J1_STIAD|nr:serine/threonine-protein kinase [Stigmatella aurantiaca]ADO68619.1 Protein kinase [Stigmatella aurantiaca DW4/3-1]EAU67153.1 protein kinase [Stigmatella aurantiaca DW4/3-1]
MDTLSPEALPDGTRLGPWRVEGRAGYGTYGAVYRVRRTRRILPQLVALKLARYPDDLRFEREAELLTRIRHPSVPRLLGQGTWKASPHGDTHPYVVMQWVEGLRLYTWGKERPFTSRQVLRLLAQVARALEATHARQGLHRDVKGDNILVSPEGKAFLMDFGCGTWAGAPPLTEGLLAPGTKPYRSPQALRFQWDHRREARPPYRATPADDVYALGVTAYRLCTGIYPPPATDPSLVGDNARETLEEMKPPGQLQPLAPLLESLILRMLSDNPQDRGSAGELAAALEAAAEAAGPEADAPMSPNGSRGGTESVRRPVSESQGGCLGPAVLMSLAAWLIIQIVGNLNLAEFVDPPPILEDGGTTGVADASVEEVPVPNVAREPEPSGLALEMPKAPLPGQRRPPCARFQIHIQGGCWLEVPRASPPCGESYDWKGACYYPVAAPPRTNTSEKQ